MARKHDPNTCGGCWKCTAGSVLGYQEARRPGLGVAVQVTPGEVQKSWKEAIDGGTQGPYDVFPQSMVPHRPSRRAVVFFATGNQVEWADDFLMGHETIGYTNPNTPRGRLSTMDDRRNIGIPARISYGASVGESDGVSPYGLD